MLLFKCYRHTIHTYIHLYIYVYITYNAIIIQCYSHVMYVIVEFISVTGIYPQNGFHSSWDQPNLQVGLVSARVKLPLPPLLLLFSLLPPIW